MAILKGIHKFYLLQEALPTHPVERDLARGAPFQWYLGDGQPLLTVLRGQEAGQVGRGGPEDLPWGSHRAECPPYSSFGLPSSRTRREFLTLLSPCILTTTAIV